MVGAPREDRPGARIHRFLGLALVALLMTGTGLAFAATSTSGSRHGVRPDSATRSDRSGVLADAGSPIVGILGVSGNYFPQEAAAGIGAVTINVGWNDAEPSAGAFSLPYLQNVQATIAAARTAGLSVVLDPGLQYPPSWVLSLPGGTQFVNQYGDVFTGSQDSGDDVANAVTDLAVRSAEATYLEWLGSQISPGEVIAVRQGGGPLGELGYPGPDYNGHHNSFWAYDVSTQAASSVPGWIPGTGSVSQATAFLNAYNAALDSYGEWLNGEMANDFETTVLVMLPGWGERPGEAANEENHLLALPLSETLPEFNEGLDWTDLLTHLPDASQSVAYTTYLDAASAGPSLQLEDPADYIASLVVGTPLRLGGENTGDGTVADLALCMDRARTLNYFIVQWMDESQLLSSSWGQDAGGPTMAAYGAAGASPLSVVSSSLPAGAEGQGYTAALTASAGVPPYTWSIASGALPPGLGLNASTGVVSGVPSAAGLATFTLAVNDYDGDHVTAAMNLSVGAGAPPTLTAPIVGAAATPDGGGYWIADAWGGVRPYGNAHYYGSMRGDHLDAPITHIVSTTDGGGYWLVAADGGVFSFGDAPFYGSMGGKPLSAPVCDIAPTSDGRGYYLVGTDGGVFAFGDAVFHGSMGGRPLNQPVVGIVADNATGGYWEVATDGGVFAFGAPFFGSTGSVRLTKPINGMAATDNDQGYWFVASDGGVFAFGQAAFHGSASGSPLNAPVMGMGADTATGGYWLVAADGGIFSYDAPFYGSG